jgi:hypothetical protein
MSGDFGFGRTIVLGLRAAWAGDSELRERVRRVFFETPGRAEGRVADWSVDRVCGFLRRDSRRRLAFGDATACELTGDERQLMSLLDSLRNGRDETARMQAQWLVKPGKIPGLVERLRPLADIANAHDVSDADLHRQSIRTVLDAHHAGAM